MKRSLVTIIGTIVLSLGHVGMTVAMDGFLLIPGLSGESMLPGRADWTNIRAASWQHGDPSALGVTTAATKVLFQPLVIVKSTDSISPALAMAAAGGKAFPTAVVELTRTVSDARVVFVRLELSDVRVAAYTASVSTPGDLPTEELKLSYGRIRWTVFK